MHWGSSILTWLASEQETESKGASGGDGVDGEGGRVGGAGGADGGRNSMVMVLSSDGLNGSVMLISFLFELERW